MASRVEKFQAMRDGPKVPTETQIRAEYKSRGWTDEEITKRMTQILERETVTKREQRRNDRIAQSDLATARRETLAKVESAGDQNQLKRDRKKHFHQLRMERAAQRRGGDILTHVTKAQEALARMHMTAETEAEHKAKFTKILEEPKIRFDEICCFTCDRQLVPRDKFQWCSGCRKIRYCCRTAQKQDWPRHKPDCLAARVAAKADSAATTALLVPSAPDSDGAPTSAPARPAPRVEEVD